ncbi:MAG: B12-binding domain-containing protein, partial [Bdellovibrionota bacterium]
LKLVTLLVRKGFLIGNIASSAIEDLSALVNDAQAIPHEDTLRLGRSVEYVDKIKRSLGDYELLTVQALLQQARVEHGVKAFLLEILMPLMQYIGEAVTNNKFGIGQEHAYSAIVRSELMQLLYLFSQSHSNPIQKRQESAKIFAIATNEGNQHEFGALISAVICAFHGFPVYYFGCNMPAVPLAEAAKAVGANCILLGLPSVTLMPPESLDQYVSRLRGEMSSICQLWVGGQITESMVADRNIRKLSSLIELDNLLSSIRTI